MVKLKMRIKLPLLVAGFCSPGYYCTGGADTVAPKARAVQLTCFCDLLPESSHSEYYLCTRRHNTVCTTHSTGMLLCLKQAKACMIVKVQPLYLFLCTENGTRNCMNVNSRFSSDSALNSESALEVTQAVCSDFTGDICPIGKDCLFVCVFIKMHCISLI